MSNNNLPLASTMLKNPEFHISEVQKILQLELDKLDKEIVKLESQKENLLTAFNTINDLKLKTETPKKEGPTNGTDPKKTKVQMSCFCGFKTVQQKRWKDHGKTCPGDLGDLEKKLR